MRLIAEAQRPETAAEYKAMMDWRRFRAVLREAKGIAGFTEMDAFVAVSGIPKSSAYKLEDVDLDAPIVEFDNIVKWATACRLTLSQLWTAYEAETQRNRTEVLIRSMPSVKVSLSLESGTREATGDRIHADRRRDSVSVALRTLCQQLSAVSAQLGVAAQTALAALGEPNAASGRDEPGRRSDAG